MKKRIVALLLCCVMLLTLSPSLIASASADDENTAAVTEDKKDESAPASDANDVAKDESKNETKDEAKAETKDEVKDEAKEEQKPADEPKNEEPAAPEQPAASEDVKEADDADVPTEDEETGDGIVSFTNVAPLVSGAAPMLKTMRAAAQANDETTGTGVELKKSVTKVSDSEYKITLEAYATGSSEMSSTSTPVDIVLVLDVSGSMDEDFGSGKDRQKKIVALKNSVNNFIDSVNQSSPTSQIAIVKFSGNINVNIGNDTYTSSGYTYNYSQVVKGFTVASDANKQGLRKAVNDLKPAGATAVDNGMTLAYKLLNGDTIKSNGHKKVVVMFTDGVPTTFSEFSGEVAGRAISESKKIKDMGATVYTIGIFDRANGKPITSEDQWDQLSRTNKYMHLVSSNYPDATGWNASGYGSVAYPGVSKQPDNSNTESSYFLSPSNAAELDKVFQAIANEAISGVNQALDSTAYIQDTVTEYFDVPTGTDAIQYFTADCTGKDTNGNLIFGNRTTASGVRGEFTGKTLTVSGFDFKGNWCGSKTDLDGKVTYQGKKLIIEFTVKVRDGFLGGNGVPTNVGKTDGIYDKDGKLVDKFPQPKGVDVDIPDITVTAQDKNVYLLGSLTAKDLTAGAEAKYGTTNILGYGADAWEDDYVTITPSAEKGFTDLTDDKTYTLTVKVEPKNKGTVEAKSATSAEAKINVFKPEVTFKDSQITLGETANYADNYVNVEWKHGTTPAPAAMGTAPTLAYTYDCAAGAFQQDTPVKVSKVEINGKDVTSHVTFYREACSIKTDCPNTTVKVENGADNFIVHVKSLSLKITKLGASNLDKNQSFVFVVSNDRNDALKIENLEVVIHGNDSVTLNGLPIGNYTVTEKAGWSWRYTPEKNDQSITLVATKDNTVTFNNSRIKDLWLTGGAWCDNNWATKAATKSN